MQVRLKVLGRPLLLPEEERVSQDAISDAELPERFYLSVPPCGTARHRVLQRPDCLAAARRDEALAVDGDDVEAHVVSAVKGHDRFLTPRFREVFFQEESFLSS